MTMHLIAVADASGLAPLLGMPPPYAPGDVAISFAGPSIGFIADGRPGLEPFAAFNAAKPQGLTFAEFFDGGSAVYAPSAATPEPASWIMVALGLSLAMLAGRRRRKTARAIT